MECLIQVFPDEFHLATLDTLLGVCTQLQPTVDVRVIVSSLIDRLAEYAARQGAARVAGTLVSSLRSCRRCAHAVAALVSSLRSRPRCL